VLHHGQAQLIEYIATKIVFFDLREDFVARLYYPTPYASPLSALVQEGMALDLRLAEVSAEIMSCESISGTSDLLWALLERVCEAVVQAVEWCLVGEPMGAIDRFVVCLIAGFAMWFAVHLDVELPASSACRSFSR